MQQALLVTTPTRRQVVALVVYNNETSWLSLSSWKYFCNNNSYSSSSSSSSSTYSYSNRSLMNYIKKSAMTTTTTTTTTTNTNTLLKYHLRLDTTTTTTFKPKHLQMKLLQHNHSHRYNNNNNKGQKRYFSSSSSSSTTSTTSTTLPIPTTLENSNHSNDKNAATAATATTTGTSTTTSSSASLSSTTIPETMTSTNETVPLSSDSTTTTTTTTTTDDDDDDDKNIPDLDAVPRTPEELMKERMKLRKLAKEYGVNLDGTPYQNDEDDKANNADDDDDDNDNPPDDDDDDDDTNTTQQQSEHRSTNIGIPPRPQDPIIPPDGKTVRVMFCYSKYEIMDGTTFQDTVGQFIVPLNYDAIVQEACEFYQEEKTSSWFSLEYYHKKRWIPLTEDCYDILLHYHKEQILHHEEYQTLFFIRLPFMYDTSDYPEEQDHGMGGFNSLADAAMGNLKGDKLPNPPPTVQDKIIQILQLMKKKKFKRDPTSPSPYDINADIMEYKLIIPPSYLEGEDVALKDPDAVEDDDDDEEHEPIIVRTRDYVLNVCRTDYDLRDILLLNVNALSHMVKCIHYDIYWNFPLPKRQDIPVDEQEDDIAVYDLPKNPLIHMNDNINEEEEEDNVSSEHDLEFNSHHHDHHEHTAACRH